MAADVASSPQAPGVRFPHPLVLMLAGVAIAAILTWILPAGVFERQHDPVTGRDLVVAGSFHLVAGQPVGLMGALLAVPRGFIDAASVIATVFICGGAFTVVERTGALHWAVDRIAYAVQDRPVLVVPVVSLAFAGFGALENMQEEIIALVPVLLLLTSRLGFDPVVAVAISIGAAAVGAAFSPVNPFQVGIAQKIAGLPALSGGAFRSISLVAALAVWIWMTARFAVRTRGPVPPSPRAGPGHQAVPGRPGRMGLVLAMVVLAFGMYVIGVARLDWGFDELSAIFLALAIVAGVVGGLSLEGTAEGLAEGFRSMAYAALLIGFARAIYVVLDQGRIIDTIVNGLFTPVSAFPAGMAALGMMVVQAALHVPVPSVSGQAVLTMPVLVPLSDLLGLSRQVTVLAYQFGAGLCELVTPTNGAMVAIVAAAKVDFGRWLRFAIPAWLLLSALGAAILLLAVALGLH